MKSSPKRILRNQGLDGVVFCSPNGDLETRQEKEQQERDQLKTLEDFWYSKGLKEGKAEGFEQGYKEGEEAGARKGSEEGFSRGFEDGKSEGIKEGHQQGKLEAEKAFEEQVYLIETITQGIRAQQSKILEYGKPEIVKFALAVGGKLARQELKNAESLGLVVAQLLEEARTAISDSPLTLCLAPSDYAVIGDELGAGSSDVRGVKVLVDKSLPQGDCRVEAPMGLFNFNISRQLEILEKRVLEVHEEALSTPEKFQVNLCNVEQAASPESSSSEPLPEEATLEEVSIEEAHEEPSIEQPS